jgi:uncharacterized membrane protein
MPAPLATISLTALVMILTDVVFLSVMNRSIQRNIVAVQGEPMQIRWPAVIVTYIFMVLGLFVLVLQYRRPIWHAAVLGVVMNGVYEGTNYASLKNYSLELAVIDTLWGAVLMSWTTWVVYSVF